MTQTTTAPSIFAHLPNEVLHAILQHAAAADAPTALALTLVASWVRRLVEPSLFHTVVLSTARSVHAFNAALSHKPCGFAARHVKHLGVFAPGPSKAIDEVLDACRGVDSLACGFAPPSLASSHDNTTTTTATTNPTKEQGGGAHPKEQHLLGQATRDGWDVTLVRPSVTHLRVHLAATPRLHGATPSSEPLDASHLEGLACLPALTHLGVVYRPTKARPATALLSGLVQLLAPPAHGAGQGEGKEEEKKLSLVLVQVLGRGAAQALAVEELNAAALSMGGDAVRVVAEPAPASAVCQWEDGVRGGRGVWDAAEGVVQRRLEEQKKKKQEEQR